MSIISEIEKIIGNEYNNSKDGAFICLARGNDEMVDSAYLVMGNASTVFTSVCNELARNIVRWADGDLEKMREGLREFRTELGKMCYQHWEEEHMEPDLSINFEMTEEQKAALLGNIG